MRSMPSTKRSPTGKGMRMTEDRVSLADFAKARGAQHGGTSWMETLPPDILEEAKAGWRAGLRLTPITEWLKSLGYEDATEGKVAWLRENA